MTLKKYNELGHVHRNKPCVEYPGKWIVYINGSNPTEHESLEEAKLTAYNRQDQANVNVVASVCWACSDNDPRIGEIWFTPFYRHGQYNIFGQYVET